MSIITNFPTPDQLRKKIGEEKTQEMKREQIEGALRKILLLLKKLDKGPVEINWIRSISRSSTPELRKEVLTFLQKRGYDVEETDLNGVPIFKFGQLK